MRRDAAIVSQAGAQHPFALAQGKAAPLQGKQGRIQPRKQIPHRHSRDNICARLPRAKAGLGSERHASLQLFAKLGRSIPSLSLRARLRPYKSLMGEGHPDKS